MATTRTKNTNRVPGKIAAGSSSGLPQFCDYSCSFASFTQPNASGACRKELAVYCTKFKRHNNKNAVCLGSK